MRLFLSPFGASDTSPENATSDATVPQSQNENENEPSDANAAAGPSDQADAAAPTNTSAEDLDEVSYISDIDCNDRHPLIHPNALGYRATLTALALSRYLSCGLVSNGNIHC